MTLFEIDILDASGNKLGDGPLKNILDLSDTRSLDQVGTVDFTMPANDTRTKYLTLGSQFDVYDKQDGYLGRFLYKSKSVSDTYGIGQLDISAWDALNELTHYSVHFRRAYVNEPVEDVIEDLISLVSGWAASIDAGIGNTSPTFEGETVLGAIGALSDMWGQHYRLETPTAPGDKVLGFGAFGDDSGVRLINARALDQASFWGRDDIAIVDRVALVEERDEVFNRIIPLGAGQGTIQQTIREATVGDYSTQIGSNQDSSYFYYIEDSASVAAYGLREIILSLPKVRAISNSDANITNAANALKLAAEVFLLKHLAPRVTYDVAVRGLRRDILPGQTVRLSYVGAVDGFAYMEIEDDFYVMDMNRSRSASGDRSATLTIASIADRQKSNADVMTSIISDLGALKVHVPVSLTDVRVGPYVRRIDSSNDATFIVRIKAEVRELNRAIVELRTSPLKSSVKATAGGGGTSTTTASGGSASPTSAAGGDHNHKMFNAGSVGTGYSTHNYGARDDDGGALVACKFDSDNAVDDLWTWESSGTHTHTVTVPAHTHDLTLSNHTHNLTYGIYADSLTPDTVRIEINGIDRTAALSGPWAVGGGAIDIELDITTYLVNASGGLRQDHEITITCDSDQGEVELGVEMLMAIQPIAVS